jgi:(R,R)-butanediol dehydrogenase/meso-butanediol dehydrogenase/diacetyl reductase
MRGERRIEIEDVPTPEPGPDQVLLKIKYSALCGSDVHRFQYGMAATGSIMGHEYCGTVVQTGANVTRFKEGDRVVGGGGRAPADFSNPLRSARYSARTVGFETPNWGGFAEYAVLDQWRPLRIPETVSDELAVLTEPCAVAVLGLRLSRFLLGDVTVVLGAGAIGLLLQQVLDAGGAKAVYVSEPTPGRRAASGQLGAARIFDPNSDDVVSEIVRSTEGIGPPVVFDCAAGPHTLQQALEMVRRGGQVVVVSLAWEDVPLLTVEWVGREVEMKASYGSTPEDWEITLQLMERGQIDHEPLIGPDHFITFDQVESSLERLIIPDEQVQLVLVP